MHNLSLDITNLRRLYRERRLMPAALVERVHARAGGEDVNHVWIARLTREQMLAYALALEGRDPASLPLYGIPFAIKDNIDLAGVPTTAACPDYAYMPPKSATVVQRLVDAGAIPVGKTNLDQFATGLVGTRSPYGACRNSFDPQYISGGSSSGSAVAVALGQVSFALGTDTAGSGRVPAAFNNLVGLKPTRGLLSTAGVVPACRTLDAVSVFALTAGDAREVLTVAAGFDPGDPYSRRAPVARAGGAGPRFRFGVPRAAQLEFFGNREYAALFDAAVERLEVLGGSRVELDFAPFLEAARLLYEGPWLAERYAAIRDFVETRTGALHAVTRAIIERGRTPSAVDAFEAAYRLAALRRAVEPMLASVDVIVTPTAGTIHRIAEVEADPVRLNSQLGYYTNFMNLLDLAAVAVPAGFTRGGLPFGITLFADVWSEHALLDFASRLEPSPALPLGATGMPRPAAPAAQRLQLPPSGYTTVAVCGAHLSGLPLNRELTARGGFLLVATHTAPHYRLYALPGDGPRRPGLVRVADDGAAIEVEVWALPLGEFGSFVAGIPAPLGIGTIELAGGGHTQGFVCEHYALARAEDITRFGGWRAWLASSV
jgi:allophanate hydrolase